eukprot:Pompholyxophrys_punicea_v1_NODE_375_length_2103_cov_7.343750.p1 type:complete len:228 gc:universal NODE_375_length_2103_cov_7.343750:1306-623(-)
MESFRKDLVVSKSMDGKLRDIVDGRVWSSPEWSGYLSDSQNLALMLNFDFFSPFETRTRYSVGFLYLTVLNLKRQSRYKRENVIFLGVIPGPSEPKLHINGYLQYLVEDLIELDKSIPVKYTGQVFSLDLRVRARLFCISADLPAIRKVLAFMSCNADAGCSKCEAHKTEHVVEGKIKKDWSTDVKARSWASTLEAGQQCYNSSTETAAENLSSVTGIRFCILSKLF